MRYLILFVLLFSCATKQVTSQIDPDLELAEAYADDAMKRIEPFALASHWSSELRLQQRDSIVREVFQCLKNPLCRQNYTGANNLISPEKNILGK